MRFATAVGLLAATLPAVCSDESFVQSVLLEAAPPQQEQFPGTANLLQDYRGKTRSSYARKRNGKALKNGPNVVECDPHGADSAVLRVS